MTMQAGTPAFFAAVTRRHVGAPREHQKRQAELQGMDPVEQLVARRSSACSRALCLLKIGDLATSALSVSSGTFSALALRIL
ncbi:MAG TPA: hypothetical protein VF502_12450, partial [Stellaceae bacterium]